MATSSFSQSKPMEEEMNVIPKMAFEIENPEFQT